MDRVVVVGAGPVGVTAALLLAGRGVPCLVLDRRAEPYPLPRAVHVDDEVVRILQEAGVAEDFLRVSRPGAGLRLLDARHRVMAEFHRAAAAGPHGYPQANMFDQPDLERLLRARLARCDLVELRGGADVFAADDSGVRYRDDSGAEHHEPAAAVLGCDGANSTVRALIGAHLIDLKFAERWLVVDGVCEQDLGAWGGVHQVCDPRRAATFMELGPRRYRWEFRLLPGETPDLDLAALLAPWLGGAAVRIVRRAEYTFRANLADRWRSGRVFLLGDAAHQTPPFIGQGLGAGLRDAYNLSWKLAAYLSGSAGEALLSTYECERSPHVRSQIRLAIVAGWAMTGGQDRAAAVRRVVLGAIWRLPGLKSLALRSTSPPLRGVGRGRAAGRLAPQPPVLWQGREVRLDEALGPGWSVLHPGEPPPAREAHHLVRVTPALDPTGALRRWLRGRTVVLRPDRVVHEAFRSWPRGPGREAP